MTVHRRRRRQRGFTLLELLVTLAITVIGLTGLLSLHVVTVKSNELTSKSGEAVGIAQDTLESYRNKQILPDLLNEFGVASLPIDTNLDTVAGRAGTTFARRLTVTELTGVSNSLVKMRVEVTWTDDGAAAGAEGGALDHKISLEVIRTYEELL